MTRLKVGSLNYATEQGLGILAKSFWDAGVLTDFLVVQHTSRPTFHEWYPNCSLIRHRPFPRSQARRFIQTVNVMLFFETPFDWALINYCKKIGVKSVLMPMYECMPEEFPTQPDLILNPSLLDQQYYPQGVHIPIPVEGIPWRLRTRAETFVHNAGHGGLLGRNGTKELLDALPLISSPIRLVIRTQDRLPESEGLKDPRLTVLRGTFARDTLYRDGDVFVFPEKFNGLSLPLQEAYASGMVVMTSDRFPNNTYLPEEPLIPVKAYETKQAMGRFRQFESAIIDPEDIAETIDKWYGRDLTDISLKGKAWARDNSWEILKPRYMEALQSEVLICSSPQPAVV